MKISIAMATYNGGNYLQCQLDSIAAQSRLPDELVVTDDGSTDATVDILASFAESAPFKVQIHRNPERLGCSPNFDKAMSLCQGDLIFLCDQDDCWLPNKLETMADAARHYSSKQLFMNDAYIADERLLPSGQTILSRIKTAGLGERDFVHGCCIAVRRTFLEVVLPVGTAQGHGNWVVAFSRDFSNGLILEVPLQFYRRHEESLSKSDVGGTEDLGKWTNYGRRVRKRLGSDTTRYLERYLSETDLRLARIRSWLSTAPRNHELYADSLTVAEILEKRADAIRARLALLDGPRYRRAPSIAVMLRQRQYSEFNGARTALRDFLL